MNRPAAEVAPEITSHRRFGKTTCVVMDRNAVETDWNWPASRSFDLRRRTPTPASSGSAATGSTSFGCKTGIEDCVHRAGN